MVEHRTRTVYYLRIIYKSVLTKFTEPIMDYILPMWSGEGKNLSTSREIELLIYVSRGPSEDTYVKLFKITRG